MLVALAATSPQAADVPSDGSPARAAAERRLAVLVVVDQMRADYLERFGPAFDGGLRRLLDDGALFTDAHQDHANTLTASGHASLGTGAHPARSGVVGNEWFERASGRAVAAVSDDDHPRLDGGSGVSPSRLQATTLGDWLIAAHPGAKVLSVAWKDRSAIFLGGHEARDVYWKSRSGPGFTTSRYYRDELPTWMVAFGRALVDRAWPETWELSRHEEGAYDAAGEDDFPAEAAGIGRTFPHRLRGLGDLGGTPFADELLLELCVAGVRGMALGADATPDLLCIGLSATDAIGHAFGPDSVEIQDQMLRLDASLGDFLAFLDDTVGRERYCLALSSDHGVVPLPELAVRGAEPRAHRTDFGTELRRLDERLDAELGEGDWIAAFENAEVYLDRATVGARGLAVAAVARRAAELLAQEPDVARAVVLASLAGEDPPRDALARRLLHSYHPERSGDVALVLHPYVLLSGSPVGTSHGSPHDYDTHVPLAFLGAGVAPGRRAEPAATVDLAPTLARWLGVTPPEGLDGRILDVFE